MYVRKKFTLLTTWRESHKTVESTSSCLAEAVHCQRCMTAAQTLSSPLGRAVCPLPSGPMEGGEGEGRRVEEGREGVRRGEGGREGATEGEEVRERWRGKEGGSDGGKEEGSDRGGRSEGAMEGEGGREQRGGGGEGGRGATEGEEVRERWRGKEGGSDGGEGGTEGKKVDTQKYERCSDYRLHAVCTYIQGTYSIRQM